MSGLRERMVWTAEDVVRLPPRAEVRVKGKGGQFATGGSEGSYRSRRPLNPFVPMAPELRSRIFREYRVAGKGGQFAKGGGRVPANEKMAKKDDAELVLKESVSVGRALTAEESLAVRLYKGGLSGQINSGNRGGESDNRPAISDRATLATTTTGRQSDFARDYAALAGAKTAEEDGFIRTVGASAKTRSEVAAELTRRLDSATTSGTVTKPLTVYRGVKFKVAGELHDDGFASVTANRDVAVRFAGKHGTILSTTLEPGAAVLSIGGRWEAELLLPRGSSMHPEQQTRTAGKGGQFAKGGGRIPGMAADGGLGNIVGGPPAEQRDQRLDAFRPMPLETREYGRGGQFAKGGGRVPGGQSGASPSGEQSQSFSSIVVDGPVEMSPARFAGGRGEFENRQAWVAGDGTLLAVYSHESYLGVDATNNYVALKAGQTRVALVFEGTLVESAGRLTDEQVSTVRQIHAQNLKVYENGMRLNGSRPELEVEIGGQYRSTTSTSPSELTRLLSGEWLDETHARTMSESFREFRTAGLGGQFAKGGGRVPGKAVTALAEGIAANAVAIEPEVTATVAGIVADAGGRMDGLAHRLKTPESMARKIDVKARERGITHEASAARISDAVRYTAVVGEARYSDSVHRTIADLESKGYKAVELETHWQRGDAYNGVHLIVQHPNGVKVEIQFHTEASIAAKGQTHKIYEKARLSTTTPEQRRQMTHEMIRIADTAAIPPGADSIGTMVFRPPSD